MSTTVLYCVLSIAQSSNSPTISSWPFCWARMLSRTNGSSTAIEPKSCWTVSHPASVSARLVKPIASSMERSLHRFLVLYEVLVRPRRAPRMAFAASPFGLRVVLRPVQMSRPKLTCGTLRRGADDTIHSEKTNRNSWRTQFLERPSPGINSNSYSEINFAMLILMTRLAKESSRTCRFCRIQIPRSWCLSQRRRECSNPDLGPRPWSGHLFFPLSGAQQATTCIFTPSRSQTVAFVPAPSRGMLPISEPIRGVEIVAAVVAAMIPQVIVEQRAGLTSRGSKPQRLPHDGGPKRRGGNVGRHW